jgi:hypothetical protein
MIRMSDATDREKDSGANQRSLSLSISRIEGDAVGNGVVVGVDNSVTLNTIMPLVRVGGINWTVVGQSKNGL